MSTCCIYYNYADRNLVSVPRREHMICWDYWVEQGHYVQILTDDHLRLQSSTTTKGFRTVSSTPSQGLVKQFGIIFLQGPLILLLSINRFPATVTKLRSEACELNRESFDRLQVGKCFWCHEFCFLERKLSKWFFFFFFIVRNWI